MVSHNYGLNRSSRILHDAAGYIKDRQLRTGERYEIKIFYEDGAIQDSGENTWFQGQKVPRLSGKEQLQEWRNADRQVLLIRYRWEIAG